MTSMCHGLSLFAPGGGKMRDPGNEVGTKIWNDRPNTLKKSHSYYIFKRKMKLIILNN